MGHYAPDWRKTSPLWCKNTLFSRQFSNEIDVECMIPAHFTLKIQSTQNCKNRNFMLTLFFTIDLRWWMGVPYLLSKRTWKGTGKQKAAPLTQIWFSLNSNQENKTVSGCLWCTKACDCNRPIQSTIIYFNGSWTEETPFKHHESSEIRGFPRVSHSNGTPTKWWSLRLSWDKNCWIPIKLPANEQHFWSYRDVLGARKIKRILFQASMRC